MEGRIFRLIRAFATAGAMTLLGCASLFTTVAFAGDAEEEFLLVIAAPSIGDTEDDPLFADVFQNIVDFDVAYANSVLGHDQIRIVVDEATRPFFEGRVPDEILVDAELPHIWMRDYTTINPFNPVQFRYTAASFEGDQAEADYMQDGFSRFINNFGLSFEKTDYVLDGGNIVDNYAGRVVTTDRFLEDNDLSEEEGRAVLRQLLGAQEVAILPPDDDILAHSDGMVMFTEENTIIVNRYPEPLRSEILDELQTAFPGIEIVEIEAALDWDDKEGGACGINVNATVTGDYIYMPHFGDGVSDRALETIRAHTTKTVIPVPANKVCDLGGSVRCLTWQLSGPTAVRLLSAMSE
ncbi:agmatine deiminase family protein [Hoeflea sp. TYP-13]|uniref:agmatine deiminase family protein n=1 Tax=Hoeflea sp. TYP-13 TaxID=3230023 RepID=UPI0034C6029F